MIQIFGTNKLFDTKSAERFFKERRMDFQFVDLKEKKMSAGEFDSVVSALARLEGGRTAAIEAMIDKKAAAGLLDEFYEQISFLYVLFGELITVAVVAAPMLEW